MDAVIGNCYRLAKFYSIDPQIFLAKPVSAIDRDLYWTDKITEGDRIEDEWQAKLRGE